MSFAWDFLYPYSEKATLLHKSNVDIEVSPDWRNTALLNRIPTNSIPQMNEWAHRKSHSTCPPTFLISVTIRQCATSIRVMAKKQWPPEQDGNIIGNWCLRSCDASTNGIKRQRQWLLKKFQFRLVSVTKSLAQFVVVTQRKRVWPWVGWYKKCTMSIKTV